MWYHDHAMHITAVNAYYGQAGFYILTDPAEEARYRLPRGRYDIPLMLQSKQYRANGDLVSPAGEKDSLFGDVIHVVRAANHTSETQLSLVVVEWSTLALPKSRASQVPLQVIGCICQQSIPAILRRGWDYSKASVHDRRIGRWIHE